MIIKLHDGVVRGSALELQLIPGQRQAEAHLGVPLNTGCRDHLDAAKEDARIWWSQVHLLRSRQLSFPFSEGRYDIHHSLACRHAFQVFQDCCALCDATWAVKYMKSV